MMYILHNNWLLIEKSEIYSQNFELFVRNVEKMDIYSKKIILEKKRFVLLFAFKWFMTMRGKFQNQWGDRFAREGEQLMLSRAYSIKMSNTDILCFETKRYTIILTFWWGIRIYQTWKITVNGRGQNLKFSQSDANFLLSQCSQYFKNFFPKTWSNSNKKVIFRISTARSIWLCSFRPKTRIVLHFLFVWERLLRFFIT